MISAEDAPVIIDESEVLVRIDSSDQEMMETSQLEIVTPDPPTSASQLVSPDPLISTATTNDPQSQSI